MEFTTSKRTYFNSIDRMTTANIGLAMLLLATPAIAKDASVTVALKYDWPADLAGNMKMIEKETIINDDGEEISSTTGTARVTTALHNNGLLVSISDVVYETGDSSDDQSAIDSELDMKFKVAMYENSWLIASGGALIEVMGNWEKIAEIKGAMVQGITDLDADMPDSSRQSFLGMVDAMLSKERIVEAIAWQWKQNVEQWDGMTLQKGEPQKIELETPSLIPGETLTSIGTYELLRRLPCSDGETENRCVELKFSSELTEESQAIHDEYLSNMYKNMFKDFEEILDHKMEIPDTKSQQYVILVTDPNTLIPYSVIEEETTTIGQGPGHVDRQSISNLTKLYEYQ